MKVDATGSENHIVEAATAAATTTASAAAAVAKGEELILYLEPRPASQLRQAIESLLTDASLTLGPNEALRYMPHITMVGFFSVPDTATTQGVQASLDAAIPSFFENAPQQQLQLANKVCQPHPDSVLIDIKASHGCHKLIQNLKNQFPSLHIRLKAINHLSLCYWLESDTEAPLPETRRSIAATTAQLARAQLPLPAENAQWDIVLYSIQDRNHHGHEPYPFNQVHRWQLPS
ncbi:hypothetical protein DFQ26_006307 [Actinomortierella ambigua]|nr:hypothetical protein DFQ26_006307 [Actinomortierella ambigua]